MAFGIDDALTTAAAGISLADTVVEIIKRYRSREIDADLEILIEEIRIEALKRINEQDLALSQFERMLVEKHIDIGRRISDVIAATPFWQPFEQRRLSQVRKRFNEFADSIYSAGDDIAALARCRGETEAMGMGVVESAREKHRLNSELLGADSLHDAIKILRKQLAKYKATLTEPRPRPQPRRRAAA
jgi:hypothetical protein